MTYSPPPTINYGGHQPGVRKNSGLAIGALICGIIAFLLAWIPCVNFIAPLLALAALILGIIGWVSATKDPSQKPTFAIVGIVLAALSIVAFFVSYMILGAAAERFGGGALAWGAEQQATVLEQAARSRGVGEDEIQAARAEFDEALKGVPSDLQQAQPQIDAALRRLEERLDAAGAADETPDAGEADPGEDDSDEPPGDGAV